MSTSPIEISPATMGGKREQSDHPLVLVGQDHPVAPNAERGGERVDTIV
jgi:hypothetical protein